MYLQHEQAVKLWLPKHYATMNLSAGYNKVIQGLLFHTPNQPTHENSFLPQSICTDTGFQ